ncbi:MULTISPECIES: hydrogenase maturation peptidase HycI [Yersinia]|uniref:hydrogenase maturation peptidase HycI n=1 Tax=Yersinia TaxID=629 RepID=UPI00067D4C61|nr:MULTISPECIES: hydrogenase maturation peptidase HycI [Yersinia]ARB86791.1 hydrogenase maturation peptidase HycI [Yersinia sp. FDAARGOS_228]AVL38283.1 hydrogenase maturation peptidase HycI [Yersinia intermedia]
MPHPSATHTTALNLVLTVGNSMMGDDGAGPLLAERMTQQPLIDWQVIDGGSAPENVVHRIRALQPTRLVIVDAADMELPPGEIRIIDPERIAEMFIMSTHNLPLNFLIDQLKEDISEVIFVGIQPTLVAFYFPMTEPVKQAVETVYQQLPLWQGDGGFAHL